MADAYERILAFLADSENATSYGPGKFEGTADARIATALYDMVGDGACDDECGESDTTGWMGLVGRFTVGEDASGFFTYIDHGTDREALAFFRGFEEECAGFGDDNAEAR
jgi:hypothetical protein